MPCNIEHRGGLSARREKIACRGQVISGARPRKRLDLMDQHAVRGEIGSYVIIRFSPSVAALFLRDKFFDAADKEFSVSAVSFQGEGLGNCK